MTRAQKQFMILGALVVVMIAVYTRAFRGSVPKATSGRVEVAEAPTVQPTQEERLTIAQPSQQREAQRQRAMRLVWRRDPFTRGAAMGELSGLQLSGILWDSNEPIAIINGQMVRVGEKLEGYRVVEIAKDRVSVTDGTQTFQIQIAP